MEAQTGMPAGLFERPMGLGAGWKVPDVRFEEKGDAPGGLRIRVVDVHWEVTRGARGGTG